MAASCDVSLVSWSRSAPSCFSPGRVLWVSSFWKVSQDLPDYEGLAKYEPPVLTRVKTPTKAMREFCAGQPNAEVIPLVVIGHDHPMIYDWTCKGKQPTVAQQIFTVDARGFPAELWKAIAPAH